MMFSRQGISLFVDESVQLVDRGSFGGIGSDMENLRGQAFVEGFEPDA